MPLAVSASADCRAIDLRCEGRDRPIGIDTAEPQLSWKFAQAGWDRAQSAYRIIAADAQGELLAGRANVWDSGKVYAARTQFIAWEGMGLRDRTRYYWTVKVWDADGNESEYSEPVWFETGMLDERGWQASWIGGNSLLRKEFAVGKTVESARAYATGLGYYELRVNGSKAGDEVLSPSFTDYDKRVEYQVFALDEQIRTGRNTLGIMLAPGWYKRSPRALQLELTYTDGSADVIVSDASWTGKDGPIQSASIYDGECYDARAEPIGWDRPGFDAADWSPVEVYEESPAIRVAQSLPPIRVVATIEPVRVVRVRDGVVVADFGQKYIRMDERAAERKPGARIAIKHAEVLTDDGLADQRNLRKAKATDVYIARGVGVESYEPRFTYHGFRYAQFEFGPDVTLERIEARIVHSDVPEAGGFDCSHPLLNRIHQAMKWTIRTNLHSVPTDCPQRDERQGWLGDGHLVSEAAMHNFDMQRFYRKWLNDMRDVQDPESGVLLSNTAPRWLKNKCLPWMAAYFIVPWNMYQFYGDAGALREHYDPMVRLFEYMRRHEQDGLLTLEEIPADHLAIDRTPNIQVTNMYYYFACTLLVRIAHALGRDADADRFESIAVRVKERFNQQYYHPQSGYYGQQTHISQYGNAFPLWLGLNREEHAEAIAANFVWDVERARGSAQLTTGIMGTKYAVELLSRLGRNDTVYRLFTRTEFPGWGFMIASGATTIWERWQHLVGCEMNSHNHPALAAPDTWFFRELAGIRRDARHELLRFEIAPYFAPGLTEVNAWQQTPSGRLSVRWQTVGPDTVLEVCVPANARAAVLLPAAAGGTTVEETNRGQTVDARTGRFELGSGDYRFVIQRAKQSSREGTQDDSAQT